MQGYRVYDSQGVSTTLIGNAGGMGAKTGLYFIDQSKMCIRDRVYVDTAVRVIMR